MGKKQWPDTYKEKRFWRERKTVALDGALEGFLAGLDPRGKRKLVRLWENWAEVVGPEVASLASPLGRRGKKLILGTEDPMTSQHLAFLVPDILGAVHRFLGSVEFEDVRFELASGRAALDRERPKQEAPAPRMPKKPEDLGSRASEMDPDTPWGRAYAAYLEMFRSQNDSSD